MNGAFRKSLFRRVWFFSITFLFLLSGCSTMQPHLADNEIVALRSMPITIIYIQPNKKLDAYLANPSNAAQYGVGFGFIGGFVGGLTAGVMDKEHYNEFAAKLDPYNGLIRKLQISDEVYSSTHSALSAISWLKNADWRTMPQSDDSNFFHEKTRLADTQVVIFISPGVGLRSDADALNVSYNVNIYTKDPNDEYDIHRFDGGMIMYGKGIQFENSTNGSGNGTTTKESVDQRLTDIFANNGVLLTKTLIDTLPEASARLVYYLTGERAKGIDSNQSK